MITLEFTWMVLLGVIAIVALSAYCYIIYRYSKLRKECDRLEQVVCKQDDRIHCLISDAPKVTIETRRVAHLQFEQVLDDFQLSSDPISDADKAMFIINRGTLELASHMIAENCIDVAVVTSNDGRKKVIVSADVTQFAQNKPHPSAQLLDLLIKNK